MDVHRIGAVALMVCLVATASAQAAEKDFVIASGGKSSAAIVVSPAAGECEKLAGRLRPGANTLALRIHCPHHFGGMFRRPFLYTAK